MCWLCMGLWIYLHSISRRCWFQPLHLFTGFYRFHSSIALIIARMFSSPEVAFTGCINHKNFTFSSIMLSPGIIPESLGQLTSLTKLFLEGNELIGKTMDLLLMKFWHACGCEAARPPPHMHTVFHDKAAFKACALSPAPPYSPCCAVSSASFTFHCKRQQ